MKKFSERKGFIPVSEVIQTEGMSTDLRNSLWNVLDEMLWSTEDYLYRQYGKPGIVNFSKILWFHYFKKPVDTIPDYGSGILKEIRAYFFKCPWYEVYDFIEFVIIYYERLSKLTEYINIILETELSGYRIVSGHIVDISDKQEVEMLEEALRDTEFEGVNAHLKRALELYSDRKNPDYRNSIKESISAVESMARIITGNPKATLGEHYIS